MMRLLIVEDEPDLRRALVQFLSEENFAIDEAADGDEGLRKALAWEYDAVVLDLMLPRKNGWQVLEDLRRRKATPVLKNVFVIRMFPVLRGDRTFGRVRADVRQNRTAPVPARQV